MEVLLGGQRRLRGVRRREVRKWARQILSLLRSSGSELSISLVGDEEIARLNAGYRGKSGPTDVIAFAMNEGDFAGLNDELLGDVVISLDRASVQAKERGHSVMEEVTFLLIHGILHLHGYDHERGGEEQRRMEAKEREIEAALRREAL